MNKKSKSFLVLCFISALLIGTIVAELILITALIMGKGAFIFYPIIILLLLSISLLTYFSFSSFDIQEKTVLFLTLPTSIIISILAFVGNYFLKMFVNLIGPTQIGSDAGSNLTALFDIRGMMNIWLLIALIIIIYNLPSIVFMLSKKEPQQQQLQ